LLSITIVHCDNSLSYLLLNYAAYSLSTKVEYAKLRDRLGLADVDSIATQQTEMYLSYCHVLRKDDSVRMKKCMDFVISLELDERGHGRK